MCFTLAQDPLASLTSTLQYLCRGVPKLVTCLSYEVGSGRRSLQSSRHASLPRKASRHLAGGPLGPCWLLAVGCLLPVADK